MFDSCPGKNFSFFSDYALDNTPTQKSHPVLVRVPMAGLPSFGKKKAPGRGLLGIRMGSRRGPC
jgi:hypothetical protein